MQLILENVFTPGIRESFAHQVVLAYGKDKIYEGFRVAICVLFVSYWTSNHLAVHDKLSSKMLTFSHEKLRSRPMESGTVYHVYRNKIKRLRFIMVHYMSK